jgi:hypothetical protein
LGQVVNICESSGQYLVYLINSTRPPVQFKGIFQPHIKLTLGCSLPFGHREVNTGWWWGRDLPPNTGNLKFKLDTLLDVTDVRPPEYLKTAFQLSMKLTVGWDAFRQSLPIVVDLSDAVELAEYCRSRSVITGSTLLNRPLALYHG